MQQKFVVVEVSNTPSTMTLVEYLVTNGFDKFAVVTELCDHPSLKYKDGSDSPESPSTTVSTAAQHTPPRTAAPTPISTPVPPSRPRVSIDSIANALSKKTTTEKQINNNQTPSFSQLSFNKILEDHKMNQLEKLLQQKKEQDRQQSEIQRIILSQHSALNGFGIDHLNEKTRMTPDLDQSETISKASSEDFKVESADTSMNTTADNEFNIIPNEEQFRLSMFQMLNPAFGSAFSGLLDESLFNVTASTASHLLPATPSTKRKNTDGTPAAKKHRWLPVDELEESRSSRGKNCGRVHCKATYKCALCGKPTTLNSTGSRWNLLRHVIMIHSDCKPYKCWDCDFTGIKSNVISHARQCRHRSDDAHDITTDAMRTEWNQLLHECFPDYVRAKERGWQPEESPEKKPVISRDLPIVSAASMVPVTQAATPNTSTVVPEMPNVKIEC